MSVGESCLCQGEMQLGCPICAAHNGFLRRVWSVDEIGFTVNARGGKDSHNGFGPTTVRSRHYLLVDVCVCAGKLYSILVEFLRKLFSVDVFISGNRKKYFLASWLPGFDFPKEVLIKECNWLWVGDLFNFFVVSVVLLPHQPTKANWFCLLLLVCAGPIRCQNTKLVTIVIKENLYCASKTWLVFVSLCISRQLSQGIHGCTAWLIE